MSSVQEVVAIMTSTLKLQPVTPAIKLPVIRTLVLDS